jgi:CRP-like cAMP-binding protein
MAAVEKVGSPEQILRDHPFLQDLAPDYLQFMAEYASKIRFEAGQYILREGEAANHLYLINYGKVALGSFIPGRGFTTIDTLDDGKVLGWSWLIPPYHWHFDALTIIPTLVVALDGQRLRDRCEADHDFGYELLKRLALIVGQRLRATRLRLA